MNSCIIVCEKEIFFYIYSYVKLDPPIVAHPNPWEFDLNKLESLLPGNASTRIWAFLDKLLWEEDFRKNLSKTISKVLILFLFQKGRGLSFEQTQIPFTQSCFLPSLVKIGPVVLEKKTKMWKVYNDDDNNDIDRQRTNLDQKSSLEPSAKVG